MVLFGGGDVLRPKDVTSHSLLQPGVAPWECFLVNETSANSLYGSSKQDGERKVEWGVVGDCHPFLFLLSMRDMIWKDSRAAMDHDLPLKFEAIHIQAEIYRIYGSLHEWEVSLHISVPTHIYNINPRTLRNWNQVNTVNILIQCFGEISLKNQTGPVLYVCI